jgi:hypothetical protein
MTLLASCTAATTALGASVPQSSASHRIPTSYESAVMGRRILALTPLAVVSTIFPADSGSEASPDENRPAGMGGQPHGLMCVPLFAPLPDEVFTYTCATGNT